MEKKLNVCKEIFDELNLKSVMPPPTDLQTLGLRNIESKPRPHLIRLIRISLHIIPIIVDSRQDSACCLGATIDFLQSADLEAAPEQLIHVYLWQWSACKFTFYYVTTWIASVNFGSAFAAFDFCCKYLHETCYCLILVLSVKGTHSDTVTFLG